MIPAAERNREKLWVGYIRPLETGAIAIRNIAKEQRTLVLGEQEAPTRLLYTAPSSGSKTSCQSVFKINKFEISRSKVNVRLALTTLLQVKYAYYVVFFSMDFRIGPTVIRLGCHLVDDALINSFNVRSQTMRWHFSDLSNIDFHHTSPNVGKFMTSCR